MFIVEIKLFCLFIFVLVALGWALLNSRQRARRPPPTTSAPPNTEWAESHRQVYNKIDDD